MRGISKKAFRSMLALFGFIFAWMAMSAVAEASEMGLNIGAAAVFESDREEETDQKVTIHAGALADGTVNPAVLAIDEDAEEDEDAETEEVTEEASEVSVVMANVDNSVNVREEAGEDASIVGKLFKNCSGVILDQTEGWTKIESGNLVGWVSNDYLIFGEDAERMMEEVGTLKATVRTDALRVRKEPNEEAGVYKLVKNGDVLDAVEELDGWVSVQVDKNTIGYVSADYVTVEFTTEHGKTLKEIEEEARAKELAKLNQNRGAVPTSVSDVTLLAALIQAEAGNQPYEGKLAVGAVVMNRVRSGGYPNTIIGVITAPGQFPPATNGTVAAIAARGPSASCIQAAEAAVSGQSNIGGATHFARVGRANGVVIGAHVFY
ncbi:MAG: cell wall hydrolase [Lachnospiraceae bacterium]|nr:cell wall hydrolase [Lachnospiraceae bacterium]